jgi:ABC-type glycerol-3-phosphate transport system substrate-binding protein
VSGCAINRSERPIERPDSGYDTNPIEGPVTVSIASEFPLSEDGSLMERALRKTGLPESISTEAFTIPGPQTEQNLYKYQQWLKSGRPEPTLMMTDSGWTPALVSLYELENLDHSLSRSLTDRVRAAYFESAVSTATVDGSLYAVPLFVDLGTVQYRKDLVEAAGYNPDQDDWATDPLSWETFTSMIADTKANANMPGGYGMPLAKGLAFSCCYFLETLASFGGAYFGDAEYLFGPIGDRPITVTDRSFHAAIGFLRTLIYGHSDRYSRTRYAGEIMPRAVLGWNEARSRRSFSDRDVIAMRDWPYSILTNGREEQFGEDLGVMPIPYGVPEDEATFTGTGGSPSALGGWHVTMNPNAPEAKKKAAGHVIEAMMEDAFNLELLAGEGFLPPKPALFNSARATEVPVVGRYMDTLRVAGENAVPRPATAVWPRESLAISNYVQDILLRLRDPAYALPQLEAELKRIERAGA